jgi:hypothetical protein
VECLVEDVEIELVCGTEENRGLVMLWGYISSVVGCKTVAEGGMPRMKVYPGTTGLAPSEAPTLSVPGPWATGRQLQQTGREG